ncbi:hypothetical protein BV25DRAFT_983297 [Artomyces pyxidatus]|uniref:Uncharacterized protein n=1 Tax=Artomyces pyxidatus TaxID=48021 RepID=A0ACB8SUD4_9AGAM|nr:hypothetical protein BV25DRAFT_983297 [Artomyces pyxidatus]
MLQSHEHEDVSMESLSTSLPWLGSVGNRPEQGRGEHRSSQHSTGRLGPAAFRLYSLPEISPDRVEQAKILPSLSSWFPQEMQMKPPEPFPAVSRTTTEETWPTSQGDGAGFQQHSSVVTVPQVSNPDHDAQSHVTRQLLDDLECRADGKTLLNNVGDMTAESRFQFVHIADTTYRTRRLSLEQRRAARSDQASGAIPGPVLPPTKSKHPYPEFSNLPLVETAGRRMQVRWIETVLQSKEIDQYPYAVESGVVVTRRKAVTSATTKNVLVWGAAEHGNYSMEAGDVWVCLSTPKKVSISLGNGNWAEWHGNEHTECTPHPLLPSRTLWFSADNHFSWVKRGGLASRRLGGADARGAGHHRTRQRHVDVQHGATHRVTLDDITAIMARSTSKKTLAGNTAIACVPCHRLKAKCVRYSDREDEPCMRCHIRDSGCFYPDKVARSKKKGIAARKRYYENKRVTGGDDAITAL